MELKHGLHLAYCTNIHRGEDWAQTFGSLKTHTLGVRDRKKEAPGHLRGALLHWNTTRCDSNDANCSTIPGDEGAWQKLPSASKCTSRFLGGIPLPPLTTSPDRENKFRL